jgi:aryl-alcohol dehydrogenase-like predicted oxidoreductase
MSAAPGGSGLQYRTLGRTGLKVTTVGFGCMVTSDPTVIERAYDAGVNYFDTARVYSSGNNERMVGAALKGKRDKVVVSTKAKGRDKATALGQLETSLKEFGTDYFDIWYLHAVDEPGQVTDGMLEAQAEAKKQGKIRFAGLSLHNGHREVIPHCIKLGSIDVVLTTYNFAMPADFEPLMKSLHDANIGTVAMKVMAGSIKLDRSYDFERAKAAMGRPGAALAALKWSLRVPYMHTAIPSIKDADQLEENLRAMREPYAGGDGTLLAAVSRELRPVYCRMCGSCKGTCPQGLPVSDMLRVLTYAEGYGEFGYARTNWQELPEPAQAVRCGDCAGCAVRCPNGVRVQERLSRAQELFC